MKQKKKFSSLYTGIIAVSISLLFMVFVFDPLTSKIYFRYFSSRSSQVSLLSFSGLIFLVIILPRLLSGVLTGAITRKRGWQWGASLGLLGFFINLLSGGIFPNFPSAISAFIIYLPSASFGGLIGEQFSKRVITRVFSR